MQEWVMDLDLSASVTCLGGHPCPLAAPITLTTKPYGTCLVCPKVNVLSLARGHRGLQGASTLVPPAEPPPGPDRIKLVFWPRGDHQLILCAPETTPRHPAENLWGTPLSRCRRVS